MMGFPTVVKWHVYFVTSLIDNSNQSAGPESCYPTHLSPVPWCSVPCGPAPSHTAVHVAWSPAVVEQWQSLPPCSYIQGPHWGEPVCPCSSTAQAPGQAIEGHGSRPHSHGRVGTEHCCRQLATSVHLAASQREELEDPRMFNKKSI